MFTPYVHTHGVNISSHPDINVTTVWTKYVLRSTKYTLTAPISPVEVVSIYIFTVNGSVATQQSVTIIVSSGRSVLRNVELQQQYYGGP